MTDFSHDEASSGEPKLRDIALQELGFVAKAYFAPVVGPILILRQLMKMTQGVDSKGENLPEVKAVVTPAE